MLSFPVSRAQSVPTCSFSGRPAFGHGRFPLHRWGLEGRVLPPPPELEVNELPHHEGLCDANGGQNSDPENHAETDKKLVHEGNAFCCEWMVMTYC